VRGVGALLAVAAALAAPAGAAPLKLIVETVEVKTDTPPVLKGQKLYLPARVVLERIGANVTWDDKKNTLQATVPDHAATFDLGSTEMTVDGDQMEMGEEPMVIGGVTYLLDSALNRALPLEIRRAPDGSSIEVKYRWEKRTVGIGEIIKWPRFFVGRPIAVEGEYRGWSAKGLEGPVRQGPPRRRTDWILKDGTGALYVSGRRPPLDPYTDAGKHVSVDGSAVVKTINGQVVPFIKADTVTLG